MMPRHHFLNCKQRVGDISNITVGEDANSKEDKDVNLALQLQLHCDATQEESVDAQHQSSCMRTYSDTSMQEGLSETLNETTISSENISTELKQDDVIKDESLEIIDHLVEEKQESEEIVEEAIEEKLAGAEGLEDTGDFEDDAVAVTDEVLTKSFNSRDDEDVENDAVEVTDNISHCGNEKSTAELQKSKEELEEPGQDYSKNNCSANTFKNELSDGIVIPNTSDFHHDDIAIGNDLALGTIEREKLQQELPAQNLNTLEDALERQKEAERLHQEVVNQPGCPSTGDFAKAFGISANSIQVTKSHLLYLIFVSHEFAQRQSIAAECDS